MLPKKNGALAKMIKQVIIIKFTAHILYYLHKWQKQSWTHTSRGKISQMPSLHLIFDTPNTRLIYLILIHTPDIFDRYTWCTWYSLIHLIHFDIHLKHFDTHNTSRYTWSLIHLIPLRSWYTKRLHL